MNTSIDSWISINKRMPESGKDILACYLNDFGKYRIIRAQWVAAKTIESSLISDMGEYDEDTDTYYDPEGWYERIDNWDEYSSCSVTEGTITHWMPLPRPPIEEITTDQLHKFTRLRYPEYKRSSAADGYFCNEKSRSFIADAELLEIAKAEKELYESGAATKPEWL